MGIGWLCSGKALPTGDWMAKREKESKCKFCHAEIETMQLCLWSCRHAKHIWASILRFLLHSRLEGCLSYGFALWGKLEKTMWLTRIQEDATIYEIQNDRCSTKRYAGDLVWCSNALQAVCPEIAAITCWNIWKSRCKQNFEGEDTCSSATISTIWLDMVTNIRAQHDELLGG